MATTGININIEGKEELLRKIANLRDLKKQKAFLYNTYSTTATPIVKAYKRALPVQYPTRTSNQTFSKTGYVYKGTLKESIDKIRSKGDIPAIYVGPRTDFMRRGKKGSADGFFIQFLKNGGRHYSGDPTLLAEVEAVYPSVKLKITNILQKKIEAEWQR